MIFERSLFVRTLPFALAAVAAVVGLAQAAEDDFPATDKACAAEIAASCKTIKPGANALSDCLQANKATLGGECKNSINKYLKTRFEAACAADVDKLCSAEKKQGLRAIMPCLKGSGPKLAPACAKLLGVAAPGPAAGGGTAPASDAPAAAPAPPSGNPLEGFFLPRVEKTK